MSRWGARHRSVKILRRTAKEIGNAAVIHASALHCFDSKAVGENQVTQGKSAPEIVPHQVPVTGETDPRQRRGPQARWDNSVGQRQNDEGSIPCSWKTGANLVPGVGETNSQVTSILHVECQAFAAFSGFTQIFVGKGRGDRTE